MTAPTESTSVAISDGKLPDLNKPSVAIKFADMWTSGKLDKLSPQQRGSFSSRSAITSASRPSLATSCCTRETVHHDFRLSTDRA